MKTTALPLAFGALLAICAAPTCSDDSPGSTGGDTDDVAQDGSDLGGDSTVDTAPDTPADTTTDTGGGDLADAAADGLGDLANDLLVDAADAGDLAPDGPDTPDDTEGADLTDAADTTDDAALGPCEVCHGMAGNAAPPFDTLGNRATSARGVGAHRRHQGPSLWHAEVQCTECHVVPSEVGSPGHLGSELPAELVFGPLATTGGAEGGWDGERCNDAYCHGATLDADGTITDPVWTLVDRSQIACGACHGVPPGPPHPAETSCGDCHPTMDDRFRFVAPERHIDGVLDLVGGCTLCHGEGDDPAPPVDTLGNDAPSARGVGAHQSHLAASDWHTQILCSECHQVPSELASEGHVDSDLPAELDFGSLATHGGAEGGWDGTSCADTYCHGAGLDAGGYLTDPTWTTVNGSQAACGTCHGLPPAPPHPSVAIDSCGSCHSTAGADGAIAIASQHIDGLLQVEGSHPEGWASPDQHGAAFNAGGVAACATCHGDALDGGTSGVSCNTCHSGWQTNCTFCHGGVDNTTGAPPAGVDGELLRTVLAVGAHTEHVEDTAMHDAYACTRCHVLPESALTPGHIDGDGRAEVVFDSLNGSSTYDYTSGVCASSYCHGNGQTTDASPPWADDVSLGCASCHSNQTGGGADFDLSGRHRLHVLNQRFTCSQCHDGTANGNAIGDPTPHVDGTAQVQFATGVNITFDGTRCNGDCHGEEHRNDVW